MRWRRGPATPIRHPRRPIRRRGNGSTRCRAGPAPIPLRCPGGPCRQLGNARRRRSGDAVQALATGSMYLLTRPRTSTMARNGSAPRAIIAEDEAVLRDQLRDQLATLWPELRITAEAADGIAAMRAIDAELPDILFLDIQMPGLSGLDVAQQANGRCHVVFVTAYDKYAIAAFEQGAVDYVMKPFGPGRLASTVSRLKQRLGSAPANL